MADTDTQASPEFGAADAKSWHDMSTWEQSPIASAVLVLGTLFVIAVGTLFIFRPELFAPPSVDDGWAEAGLGAELPEEEIAAYEEVRTALVELAQDPTARKKAPALRDKAIELLSARAKASLHAIRVAGDEYIKHMKMFKGAEQQRRGRGRGGGIITQAHWNRVQEEWAPFQPEMREIVEQANWLRPGRPGWGAAVLQEAYDALLLDYEAEVAAAAAEGREPPPLFVKKLRFGKRQRVACNMGERGWQTGTVLRCFELPYLVALDLGGNVTAPADHDDLIRGLPHHDLPEFDEDKGTPADVDLELWKEYRFKVGDLVMANLGPQGWNRGRVRRLSVRDTTPGGEREIAYEIEIEGGRLAYAPNDLDQVVRRPTAEEAAALPKLRFKKGDKVLANMGEAGFKPGVIVACFVKRHPPPNAPPGSLPVVAPYQIKLDGDGMVVFAPRDDHSTVRPATTDEPTQPEAPDAN